MTPRGFGIFLCVLAAVCSDAGAHFQTLIPSEANVTDPSSATLSLDLRFTHPMAGGPLMSMAGVERFGVYIRGEFRDLAPTLERIELDGKGMYRTRYRLDRPGDHVFIVEPKPYWEAAEGTYIVHFAKVIVDGFGGGGGWNRAVGLPVEIVPLVQPYALWTGNTFRGRVLHNGDPVPDARVEIEYLNDTEPKVQIPAGAFETQVVRADANGEFIYTMPRGGWWGFAALVDGPTEGLKAPDGGDAEMEWGGLIWVHTRDME